MPLSPEVADGAAGDAHARIRDAAVAVGPAQRARRCGVLLVGPLPDGPIVGGIANGIRLLLNSRVATATSMRLFNTSRTEDPSRSLLDKIIYQSSAAFRFIWMTLRLRPRIVHVKAASYVNFYQSALYAALARLLRRRVILQLHAGDFRQFYDGATLSQQFLIRKAIRIPHRVVALSEGWAQYFCELAEVPEIAVIPNAIVTREYKDATPNRSRFRIPANRTVALFVGTGNRASDDDKGLSDLCDAVARVRARRPEVILVVAGVAAENEVLSRALGPVGTGWLSAGIVAGVDKPSLYRSVDLFALPSRFENMPNTLLEAMAAGLPSVSTPVGAIPEMIIDGEAGFLVPVGNVDALADRVERLAADPALRHRLGARAADIATARFDFATLEDRVLTEYRRLAGDFDIASEPSSAFDSTGGS